MDEEQKERDILQQDLTGIWTFLMDRFEVLANAILDLKRNGDLDPETIKQLKKIGGIK